MSEELSIIGNTREGRYVSLLPQILALIGDENDQTAILSNVCAALKVTFSFFWVGFYIVKKDSLVLGPFQGDVACMRINFGRGVCGTAWETKEIQIVPNVDDFEGHIACSSNSKSEIVIPILKNQEVVAVLDIDSDVLDDFSSIDSIYLNNLCQSLALYF
jgi:L-methionine (R)-S-oxide reductase